MKKAEIVKIVKNTRLPKYEGGPLVENQDMYDKILKEKLLVKTSDDLDLIRTALTTCIREKEEECSNKGNLVFENGKVSMIPTVPPREYQTISGETITTYPEVMRIIGFYLYVEKEWKQLHGNPMHKKLSITLSDIKQNIRSQSIYPNSAHMVIIRNNNSYKVYLHGDERQIRDCIVMTLKQVDRDGDVQRMMDKIEYRVQMLEEFCEPLVPIEWLGREKSGKKGFINPVAIPSTDEEASNIRKKHKEIINSTAEELRTYKGTEWIMAEKALGVLNMDGYARSETSYIDLAARFLRAYHIETRASRKKKKEPFYQFAQSLIVG